MKGIELVEKYGKAGTVIKDFYNKRFMESLDAATLPENFKEIYGAYNVDNETVGMMIDKNPGQLFEIFDAHGIYIQINVFAGGAFSYSIVGDVATIGLTDTFPTRIEAEKKVVEIALETLNNKL